MGVRTKWTHERVARLGFLIGLGWDASRVAKDPLIKTTTTNAHARAQSFGLRFNDAPSETAITTPASVVSKFACAAAQRQMTPEGLIRHTLRIIATDPVLLENILDDQR